MNVLRKYIRTIILESQCPNPKAIFMAGGPGSGKSTVIRELGLEGNISVINPDDAYEAGLAAEGLPFDREDLLSRYRPIKAEYLDAVDSGDEEKIAELEPEYSRLRNILSRNMQIFAAARKGAKETQVDMSCNMQNFLVDGTGGDFRTVSKQIRDLRSKGYDVAMIYVSVPLETSLGRNRSRGESGGRRLADSSVEKSWNAVNRNLES